MTSFVCMALIQCGLVDHAVVKNGIQFLVDSARTDENKMVSWPIDTNLATWTTTLAINALGADPAFQFEGQDWVECRNWVLNCQYSERHPFTGADPGGWGWSDLSGSVPDADDTPGAMLALKVLFLRQDLDKSTKREIISASLRGADWLFGLQNRDGGWPTFCRGWGRLPFDRSGNDLTAHSIRALLAWKSEISNQSKVGRAVERGFEYLLRNQRKDGSWLPLWFGNQDEPNEINPFYGTAKVLHAFFDAGRMNSNAAQNGLQWILDRQNADGGWGGGRSLQWSDESRISSVEETALCLEALTLQDDVDGNVIQRGIDWIAAAIDNDEIQNCSPIGFYFAKLWYFEKLYPLIFASSVLGRVRAMGKPRSTSFGDKS